MPCGVAMMDEVFQANGFLLGLEPMSLSAERLRLFILFKDFEERIEASEVVDRLELNPQKGWKRIGPSVQELLAKKVTLKDIQYNLYDDLKCVEREGKNAAHLLVKRNVRLDECFWECRKDFHKIPASFLRANNFPSLRMAQIILALSSGWTKSEFSCSLESAIKLTDFGSPEFKYFRRDVLNMALELCGIEIELVHDNGQLNFKVIKPPVANPPEPPPGADPPRQVDKQILTSAKTEHLIPNQSKENGAHDSATPVANQPLVENISDSLVERLVRTLSADKIARETKWEPKKVTPKDIQFETTRAYLEHRAKKMSGYEVALNAKMDALKITSDEEARKELIAIRGVEETLWALGELERCLTRNPKDNAAGWCIAKLKDRDDQTLRQAINERREIILNETEHWRHKIKDEEWSLSCKLEEKIRDEHPEFSRNELRLEFDRQWLAKYGRRCFDHILARNIIFEVPSEEEK